MKLTTHLIVPRSRMRGAIPPLPSMPSWRGAQLKHRDNFTFTFVECESSLPRSQKSAIGPYLAPVNSFIPDPSSLPKYPMWFLACVSPTKIVYTSLISLHSVYYGVANAIFQNR